MTDDASVRLSRTRTWGGIETEPCYGPEQPSEEYARDLGEPGTVSFCTDDRLKPTAVFDRLPHHVRQ